MIKLATTVRMALPVCLSVHQGFDVVGFDVRQESVERFVAEGGMGAATPGEAAAGAAAVVWTATVRADGSLAHEKQTGSIHGLGKELQGAPSCNGWTFWHYEVEGEAKPIDAARQLYLLAVED